MECFNHQGINAVALCKSCFKAVCKTCALTTEHGIACSTNCENSMNETFQIIERNKKIYGIGKYKSKIPSTGVLIWLIFSAVAWFTFLVPYIKDSEFNSGSFVMAIVFTIIFGLSVYSSKRTGIKC